MTKIGTNLVKLINLYLKEFNNTGVNPICQLGTYTTKVYQAIPALQSLDGHRKSVNMIDFANAVPVEPDDETPYTAD